MKYTYELLEPEFGDKLVKRSDGAFIPMDEANADYQAYLESLKDAAN